MKQINIIRNGQVTNSCTAPEAEALEWLAKHEGMGSFGQKAMSYEQQVEVSPAVLESQELLNEDGSSFDPPQFHEVEIVAAQYEAQVVEVAGYSVEIIDRAASMEQERINAEALKMLAESDWMIIREAEGGAACPQEVKDARAAARLSIVR